MTLPERYLKRSFDIFFSVVGLLICFPIIVVSWLLAAVETKSNGFFIQKRVGLNCNIIHVIKIKTMKNTLKYRSSITTEARGEITSTGIFFRKYKIDELPQLWNVLIGDMSFVGPRPDVPGYADNLIGSDRLVLTVRPGITGPASLKYKNEEEILSQQLNPKEYNDKIIWPDKVKINKEYIEAYTFMNDLKYILQTIRG